MALPRSNSLNSLAAPSSPGLGSEIGRPSTPEPNEETEREKQERRERRRLRRLKKEAEETQHKSPRKDSAPAGAAPDTPEKESKSMLLRTSSMVRAPPKPLPPIPEAARPGRSSTTSSVGNAPKTMPMALRSPLIQVASTDSDDESSDNSARGPGHDHAPLRVSSLLSLTGLASPGKEKPRSARVESSYIPGEITVKYQPKKGEVKNFISEEGSEPADLKRMKVLNEILNTERDYVRDLVTIREVFLMPIRDSKCLTEQLISTIFSNITTLLNVNKTLLKEFSDTAAKDKGDSIGICFIHLADYLKMYSIYCNNQDLALSTCRQQMKDNEKFRTFVQQQQNLPACKRNDLQSYLIKPVQRLCKYPLLLRELIKCTPADHSDRKRLDDAFTRVEQVVAAVEEGRKKVDTARQIQEIKTKMLGTERLDLVTPTRHFVKEGTIHCINEIGGMKELHVVLFNDIILVSRLTSSVARLKHHNDPNKPYLFRHVVNRSLLLITPVESTEIDGLDQHSALKHRFRIEYAASGKIYKRTFAFAMVEQKADWLHELQRLELKGDSTPRKTQ